MTAQLSLFSQPEIKKPILSAYEKARLIVEGYRNQLRKERSSLPCGTPRRRATCLHLWAKDQTDRTLAKDVLNALQALADFKYVGREAKNPKRFDNILARLN